LRKTFFDVIRNRTVAQVQINQQLHYACEAMAHNPHRDAHDEFIIQPLD
jgi:hypothetical protein